MVVGEIAEAVDLLVVGGGPGGYAVALRAAQDGRDVTLVDRRGEDGLGGVCLHEGCIPSKALIEVADRYAQLHALSCVGLHAQASPIDMPMFQEWKRGVLRRLNGEVRQLLTAAGVHVLAGDLRFTRPDQAVLRTPDDRAEFLQFADAVVATGSRPLDLPDLPIDGRRVLTSSDALALDALPGSVVVVGVDYIGLELGTALAKLGCRVTIVELGDALLPDMASELVRPVRRRLRSLGVEVLVSATVMGLDADEVCVACSDGEERRVPAEKVIVAVGRRPNTDDVGIEQLGARVRASGHVEVHADRRATPHAAAIGDITPGPALAHKASAEARVAVEALRGGRVAFDPAAVPVVVFSDPEIASAGLTADAALEAGIDVDTGTVPISVLGRAAIQQSDLGHAQLVVDRQTAALVGVHLVGPHASELIAEGVLAIEMGASVEDLALTVHAHPTLSEQTAEAAHLALGHPVHARGPRGGRSTSSARGGRDG